MTDQLNEKRDQIGTIRIVAVLSRTMLLHPACDSGTPGFRAMRWSTASAQPPRRGGSSPLSFMGRSCCIGEYIRELSSLVAATHLRKFRREAPFAGLQVRFRHQAHRTSAEPWTSKRLLELPPIQEPQEIRGQFSGRRNGNQLACPLRGTSPVPRGRLAIHQKQPSRSVCGEHLD